MKINFNHLKDVDESYLSHLKFACTLGLDFSYRAVYFLIHGVIPAVQIPKDLNLTATYKLIKKAKKKRDKKGKTNK